MKPEETIRRLEKINELIKLANLQQEQIQRLVELLCGGVK